MSDADAVRAWLTSFRGAIAAADYADEMIEAGYDSLDNMIFTKDELQESVASFNDKPSHAGRIARDAAKMVAEMGSVGPESPPEDILKVQHLSSRRLLPDRQDSPHGPLMPPSAAGQSRHRPPPPHRPAGDFLMISS